MKYVTIIKQIKYKHIKIKTLKKNLNQSKIFILHTQKKDQWKKYLLTTNIRTKALSDKI